MATVLKYEPRPVSGLRVVTWAAGGAASVLAFAIYCILSQAADVGRASVANAFPWSFSSTLCWGGLVAALAWQRERIVRMAGGGAATRVLFVLGISAAVLVADAGVNIISAMMRNHEPVLVEMSRLVKIWPIGLAIGIAVLTQGLLLAGRRDAEQLAAVVRRPAASLDALVPLPSTPELWVRPGEIRIVRSAGNYCELVTDDGERLVRIQLNLVASVLERYGFVRVHRSRLVNSARIRGAVFGGGDGPTLLVEGERVRVGRRYRAAVEELLPRALTS